jgi:hypothetical protein
MITGGATGGGFRVQFACERFPVAGARCGGLHGLTLFPASDYAIKATRASAHKYWYAIRFCSGIAVSLQPRASPL